MMKIKSEKEKLKEKLKFEAAGELGLIDKVRAVGWGNLTSKETGKIGALIAGRGRNEKKNDGSNSL
jgi:small acid-soluble spore protein F (minor alpha/beta-type SASP)